MKQGIAQVARFPHFNMNGCVCEARVNMQEENRALVRTSQHEWMRL